MQISTPFEGSYDYIRLSKVTRYLGGKMGLPKYHCLRDTPVIVTGYNCNLISKLVERVLS